MMHTSLEGTSTKKQGWRAAALRNRPRAEAAVSGGARAAKHCRVYSSLVQST